LDLLSVEGLAIALGVYMGVKELPNVKFSFEEPKETIYVTEAVKGVRPYVVGAILRDVDLGEMGYKSFIDF
jgi:phenylalanyl-tRNA synthetase beta chain